MRAAAGHGHGGHGAVYLAGLDKEMSGFKKAEWDERPVHWSGRNGR